MRIWKGTLLILLVLLMLTACGAEHSTSSEPDSTQNASESAPQSSNPEDDASDDAPLEWLPQETIVFDQARAVMHCDVHLKERSR